MTYVERRLLAFMQFRLGPNRTGPFGLLQPIADGIKLFFKEELIPEGANKWLFVAAPAVAAWSGRVPRSIAVVPYGGAGASSRSPTSRWASSTSSPSRRWASTRIVMAGWAANNKFTLLGGLRSSAQMFSYELGAGPLLGGPHHAGGLVPHPGHRDGAGRAPGASLTGTAFVQFPAFVVYVIAATAEVNRTPFDLPEAETELVGRLPHRVLVDALRAAADGRVREHDHGGGGGHEPVPGRLALAGRRSSPTHPLWFFAKFGLALFFFIWLRGTLPRFRYDQLMDFGWKVLVPVATLWILVTAGWVAFTA